MTGGICLPQTAQDKADMLTWALERLPQVDSFGPAYPIAVVRDGLPACVVVYHQWVDANIQVSIAADTPRWATRQTCAFLLGWPFWTYPEIKRITALIERRNHRSRKLCEGLGFAREGICRDLFPKDDAVIYGLTRRWWQRSKWNIKAGEQRRAA